MQAFRGFRVARTLRPAVPRGAQLRTLHATSPVRSAQPVFDYEPPVSILP